MKKRCSEIICINDNGNICTAPHTVRIPRKRHYFWSEPCEANLPDGEQTLSLICAKNTENAGKYRKGVVALCEILQNLLRALSRCLSTSEV